jgi:hypothetical protein
MNNSESEPWTWMGSPIACAVDYYPCCVMCKVVCGACNAGTPRPGCEAVQVVNRRSISNLLRTNPVDAMPCGIKSAITSYLSSTYLRTIQCACSYCVQHKDWANCDVGVECHRNSDTSDMSSMLSSTSSKGPQWHPQAHLGLLPKSGTSPPAVSSSVEWGALVASHEQIPNDGLGLRT